MPQTSQGRQVTFELRPIIKNSEVRPEVFIKSMNLVIEQELKEMIRLFGKTYHNWKAKDKPTWQKVNTLKQYGRGVPAGDVAYSVAAIRTGSKPFLWIEAGTSIRYRRMSVDFSPKTRRGYLGSGAGSGSAKGFSRFPLPGIEAREWRFQIAEMRADKFAREMGNAIERASKGLFVPGPQDTE